jgi:hypothetical protein
MKLFVFAFQIFQLEYPEPLPFYGFSCCTSFIYSNVHSISSTSYIRLNDYVLSELQ